MKRIFKAFTKKEDGAITVEFLVLCAAVAGLGVVGYAGIGNGGAGEVVNTDPDVAMQTFVAGF